MRRGKAKQGGPSQIKFSLSSVLGWAGGCRVLQCCSAAGVWSAGLVTLLTAGSRHYRLHTSWGRELHQINPEHRLQEHEEYIDMARAAY